MLQNGTRARRKVVLAGIATTLSAAAVLTTAPLGSAQNSVQAEDAVTTHAIQDTVARQTALSLGTQRWRMALVDAVASGRALDLEAVAGSAAPADLRAAVVDANTKVLAAKGLPSATGDLLTVRLADPAMSAALKAGAEPLVAVPADDDTPTGVTAYDTSGRVHTLATGTVPSLPVLVVDIDVRKALDAGSTLINQTLALSGRAAVSSAPTTAASVDTTKITAVRVSNDREPWFKGDSEIFTIVGGIKKNPDPTKDDTVIATVVKMPYLNTEKKTYYPNQILIWWNQYKFNAADAVMMEDDGDTNYQKLASALNTALGAMSKKYAAYVPVVEGIIQAIPGKWWTDDPDHVEQWYTIQKQSNGRLNGASGNGWMEVVPFVVDEL
ncbi:DUF3103 family protein [Actinokineospora sp. 24-640]